MTQKSLDFNPIVPVTPPEKLFTWCFGLFWFLALYAGQLYLVWPHEELSLVPTVLGYIPIVPLIVAWILAGYALAPTLVVLLPFGYFNKCPFSPEIVRVVNSWPTSQVVALALLLGALTLGIFMGIWFGLYLIINLLLNNHEQLVSYVSSNIVLVVPVLYFVVVNVQKYLRRKADPESVGEVVTMPTLTSKESLFRWSSAIFIFLFSFFAYQTYYYIASVEQYPIPIVSGILVVPSVLAFVFLSSTKPSFFSPVIVRWVNSWPGLSIMALALVLTFLDIVAIVASIATGGVIFNLAVELSQGQYAVGIVVLWCLIQFAWRLNKRYILKRAVGRIPESQKQVSLLNEFIFRLAETILSSFIIGLIILSFMYDDPPLVPFVISLMMICLLVTYCLQPINSDLSRRKPSVGGEVSLLLKKILLSCFACGLFILFILNLEPSKNDFYDQASQVNQDKQTKIAPTFAGLPHPTMYIDTTNGPPTPAIYMNTKLMTALHTGDTAPFFKNSQYQERIEAQPLGEIYLPTGKIVAHDAIVFLDTQAFEGTVAPGKYPVMLYIHHIDTDTRVGFAEIRFTDAVPVSFQPALMPGQKAEKLGEGEYFGYGVDAGTGCFMDEKTVKYFEDLVAKNYEGGLWGRGSGFWWAELDQAWEEVSDKSVSAVNATLPNSEQNVVIFSSGYGDGAYPSFWGFDAQGELCCLITDFLTVDSE